MYPGEKKKAGISGCYYLQQDIDKTQGYDKYIRKE